MTDQSVTKLLNRLNTLNEIGISLSKKNDINKVFEEILVSAQRLTGADAGTLYLVDEQELVFTVFANDSKEQLLGGSTGKEIPFDNIAMFDMDSKPNLANVASCAAHKKEVINIPDAYYDNNYDFSGTKAADTKNNYRSQSFLTIPLLDYDEEVLGVLQLINRKDEETGEIIGFSKEDESLAESLASQAAIKVKTDRLLDYKLQQERIKKELDIASSIQHGLVPRENPTFPGLETAYFFRPAKDVGGDFFDFYIREDESEIFITVADAAGKGLPACLYSLSLRSLLRSSYNFFDSPADILKNANNLFQADTASSSNFATIVTIGFDPKSKVLQYTSCGHPPSYLRRKNGELVELLSGGMTLGILQQKSFPQESVEIEPGDMILLFTDGLTDAMNVKGDFFGDDRVETMLKEHGDKSAKAMIDIFVKEITEFQQGKEFFDDTTIVAIKFD